MNYGYGSGYADRPSEVEISGVVSNTMKLVYAHMTLGLALTAIVAYLLGSSQAFLEYYVTHHWLMWVPIIAVFALVIGINSALQRLNSGVCALLFYAFSALMGLMLFSIFVVYSPTAIVKTFFITAGTFSAMTIYGFTTSKDLSRFGTYLIMALFGLIIASVVNIFLQSSGFDWIISIVGVIIFVGLTAWDTQQIKQMAMVTPTEYRNKLAMSGALSLYLDFINLFLYLLRIFGNRN